MKQALKAGNAGDYCQISLTTVFRWVKKGHRPGCTLPDGHHRIPLDDFRALPERHEMSIRCA